MDKNGFVDNVISLLKNNVKQNKTSLEKLALGYGISNQNLIKELTELAIVNYARELSGRYGSTFERYQNIVSLYYLQTNLSHRTSQSILLQQYSTPTPIGYLMGLFCGVDKSGNYFEPCAGNGALTIFGSPDNFVVNEIDPDRNQNLLTQGFKKVTSFDANKNYPNSYLKAFDAVIANPPFGKVDYTEFNGVEIGELDHIITLHALTTLKDDGKAAIIIGGHTKYDDAGRIQMGKNRKFLSYLYKYYHVLDIIPINGKALYSRNGTGFDTRLILIDGRKSEPQGFPPLSTGKEEIANDFDYLFNRVNQFVQAKKDNRLQMNLLKIKAKAAKAKLKLASADLGMPYVPASESCNVLAVDVPDSMGFETKQALERVKAIIGGDVDEFVRMKLGYKTKVELCKALAAEQIDAVAMGIYNIEYLGQGLIIGDQTGIGKGRQAAAMIRYARHKGLKPIFITEKPNLFSDIYRDLKAIGSENLKPYIINANESKTKVRDEEGNIVFEPLDRPEQKRIVASGKLPSDFDYVMLTYSQISDSEFNPRTGALIAYSEKASFILNLAKGNILVMDESHNASGDSNTGKVLRDIVQETLGVCFLSATFAKRPDNMPIYALKTAISEANMDKQALIDAIVKGGVALQEVLASQLVGQGQMLRRERTFEGIEVNYITLNEKEEEHKAISDNITEILRDIIKFQADYIENEIKSLDKIARASQQNIELRKGTAKAGVNSTPYFSKIFQVVNQMLFAIKAESVAQRAIMRLREGKKPVIAFSSTMGSFIENLQSDFGMPVDDGLKINADFAMVLQKGLDGVLRYTVRDSEGKSTYEQFDITEFGPEAQAEYYRISDKIKNSVSGIIISPIDLIKQKIEEAGYKVAEVTGRKYEVLIREVKAGEELPENPSSKASGTIPANAAKVIPPMQLKAIKPLLKGEEGEYFAKKLAKIDQLATELKKRDLNAEGNKWEKTNRNAAISYGYDVALPTFHYFNGSSDVYVFEWNQKFNTFYTYTILNGDLQNAEFGDTSLDELFANYGFGRSFEMDFHFDPKPISEIVRKKQFNGLGEIMPAARVRKKYIGIIRPRKKELVNVAFNAFNNNEIDVLMINQSGSTGASAHAIKTSKVPASEVKQRVMIVLQAELDINREVQKRGRVNRTGQLIKPIYDYVSSAVPAEKRLMMMLQKKLKSLDANTTSNQRQSEDLMKSDDFLNVYGDRIVFEYLLENPDLNKDLDDPLGLEESSSDNGKKMIPENLSSMVSGRVAVLETKRQEKFYNDVLVRYEKYINLLKSQDEYDLEVETMNLQAVTLEKREVIVGKGGRSPFGDNTILEKCEVNILKKPFTNIEIENLLKNELKEDSAFAYKSALIKKLEQYFENQTKIEVQDNTESYQKKIANITNEKGYKTLTNPEQQAIYVEERKSELQKAQFASEEKIIKTNENKRRTVSEFFNFFSPGKMLWYQNDLENVESNRTLAVFIGFDIDFERKNPFAPSAIDAKIAIASSKKFIPFPLSRINDLNSIIGASRNLNETWFERGAGAWDKAIKENTKDRGIRYILTGNLLQAFGWNDLLKPKLISFSTMDGKTRKGILLSESWTGKKSDGSDSMVYTVVPVAKAVKVIRSMSENAQIISDSGLAFSRNGDNFQIITSKSRSASGDIYLDSELLQLVEGNVFNSVSNSMRAIIKPENLDKVCAVLQKNHSTSVRLLQWQVDIIKDQIQANQFNDEVMPLPMPEPKKPETPNVNIALIRIKAKAAKAKLLLQEN
jgi:hypothetical protein